MKQYLNTVLGTVRPWETRGGKGLRGRRPRRLLVVARFAGLAGFWLTRLLCLSKLFHTINILWLILVILILYIIDGYMVIFKVTSLISLSMNKKGRIRNNGLSVLGIRDQAHTAQGKWYRQKVVGRKRLNTVTFHMTHTRRRRSNRLNHELAKYSYITILNIIITIIIIIV